jgi:WD40 repeat protein
MMNLIRTLNGRTYVHSIYYSHNDKQIASGHQDHSINIWNAVTGELIRTLSGHTGSVESICYSSDDKK